MYGSEGKNTGMRYSGAALRLISRDRGTAVKIAFGTPGTIRNAIQRAAGYNAAQFSMHFYSRFSLLDLMSLVLRPFLMSVSS
jgi:hypothetical protein